MMFDQLFFQVEIMGMNKELFFNVFLDGVTICFLEEYFVVMILYTSLVI